VAQADRDKWDARYRDRGGPVGPAAFVAGLADLLPGRGRALDLAGGAGRHAVWLAERGLDVTLVDVSPEAVALAGARAAEAGVALTCRALDLDDVEAGAAPFPPGPWDLILDFHLLWRPVLRFAAEHLAPGGLLAVSQPTRRNLERHASPSARYLLEEGELAGLVAASGLEVVRLREGWSAEGRHEAELVARRPGGSGA